MTTQTVEKETVKTSPAKKTDNSKKEKTSPVKKSASVKGEKKTPAVKNNPKKTAKKKTGKTDAPKTFFADPKGGVKLTAKRLSILKAMKTLKAISADNARTAEDIAGKAKDIEPHEVKHYCYKNEHLAMCGFVKINKDLEGERHLGYFLTAKGIKACAEKEGSVVK